MSVVNKGIKWQYVAGIGVICGLAVVGCSRSDKEDTAKATDAESIVDNSTAPPAIACDDPLVQDRLNTALKTTLNRQAQSLATNYASDARINLDGGVVTSKIDGIIIEVQNATMSQEANANGLTTCQASVSMTLASEDLYQASQVQAANNQPNLQTRLAQDNIRVNNNMLVDDAFTYVVSKQDGQVQVRIAGQSALVAAVADVMASSAYQAVIDNLRAARTAQQAANRAQQAVRRAGQEAVELRSGPVAGAGNGGGDPGGGPGRPGPDGLGRGPDPDGAGSGAAGRDPVQRLALFAGNGGPEASAAPDLRCPAQPGSGGRGPGRAVDPGRATRRPAMAGHRLYRRGLGGGGGHQSRANAEIGHSNRRAGLIFTPS